MELAFVPYKVDMLQRRSECHGRWHAPCLETGKGVQGRVLMLQVRTEGPSLTLPYRQQLHLESGHLNVKHSQHSHLMGVQHLALSANLWYQNHVCAKC